MPSKLVIQLLGDFHINYSAQALESFGIAHLQSILANFLLHLDIPQPRRRLAFLLLPDSSETSLRNNLRRLTCQLRQALPAHPGPSPVGDYGIPFKRSFRGLKAWMMLKTHRRERYGRIIQQNVEQARWLTGLVAYDR